MSRHHHHRSSGASNISILPRSANDVERDARVSTESLKALLQAQPPWSREVEAQRQKTRNLYLILLFAHSMSPQSQSLDPLWHATTYILISAYRESISRAEAAIPPSRKKTNRMGDPEYRKNITRFRQALASEEGFYRGLIGRIVGFYQIHDLVLAHLGDIGIPVPEAVQGDGTEQGLAPVLREEARDKVGLVYKVLICLGDIERYKEQYSDQYRNKERVRSKTGEEIFGKSMAYYEVARGLVPEDGSAFNQLAVISTYLHDDFQTTYYYFRALAVKSPFRNGEEIFERFLTKLFERWRNKDTPESEADEVGHCKRIFLVITSIIFRRSGLSQLPKLFGSNLSALKQLVLARRLPSEIIVKLACIAIASHWQARHSSSMNLANTGDQAKRAVDAKRVQEAELASVNFVLSIGSTLFDVARQELRDVASVRESALVDDEAEDSSTMISAVLRRILPALRIISKWLKLHMDYLSRAENQSMVDDFWKSYDQALYTFATVFPIDQLPHLTNPLEEDIDMQGFIPLARGMLFPNTTPNSDEDDMENRVVHPNEEQLMRISDLQVDASLISQILHGGSRSSVAFGAHPLPVISARHQGTEEDIASVSTETEDDPVNMAMRATLPEDSIIDDEEEIILWQPSAHIAPPAAPSAHDLLQNLVLENSMRTPPKGPSPHNGHSTHRPSPPSQTAGSGSPRLLFGGDNSGIWKMTRDESEKGVKRGILAEKAARDEAAQKETLKAIWNGPVHATVPPPMTAASHQTAGDFVGKGNAASDWAANDAASLYAGLANGMAWSIPTFDAHLGSPALSAIPRAPGAPPSWLGPPVDSSINQRGTPYAGAYAQHAPQHTQATWGQAYNPT